MRNIDIPFRNQNDDGGGGGFSNCHPPDAFQIQGQELFSTNNHNSINFVTIIFSISEGEHHRLSGFIRFHKQTTEHLFQEHGPIHHIPSDFFSIRVQYGDCQSYNRYRISQ
jgi:hypothetical protein